MSAKILDGKILAVRIKEQLIKDIAALKSGTGKVPRFVSISVGEDPAGASYALSQERTARELGIAYERKVFSASVTESEVLADIRAFNADPLTHAIIVNKPLPAHLDLNTLIEVIYPDKDAEGLNSYNQGRIFSGTAFLIPCTPAAVMAHIKSTAIDLKGKEAVVLGRSEIIGKPIAMLLLKENATVTICHSKTKNLPEHVQRADIVVAAIGKPLFVKGDWIKPGAIVIDVGTNRIDGKIVGDVDFESAKEKAGYITPARGGVGPVTSVMLMKNVFWMFNAQVK
ncbi:MAG: bifunctional 5,10-methylenetetrahydrofolate dehydrogenase/5,10-methenyltetrahydrofolate cyclohydrolase [Candidatus Omnitrophota bacterium]|nr:bifunctional 5,10-methylenetetrahydrofolate dehydrogenase/5,10-methenyltetrahydrofolate cyclohydrolase [Candidatus Omnitrophota bacterium]